jgi:hypothetical protein
MDIAVGNNSQALVEPMLFCLPAARRPDCAMVDRRQPLLHAAGLREISRLECVLPSMASMSSEMQSISESGPLTFRTGEEYHIEVGFDGELSQREEDFRPDLPIVLRW